MADPSTSVLDRALVLLRDVARAGGARSLSDLAQACELPSSTAYRIVGTFERHGLLVRAAPGRYVLGPRLTGTAPTPTLKLVLRAAGAKLLADLATQTGLTVHLGVLEADMVTYVQKVGRNGNELFTRPGMQLEAYCSGLGKVLLAALGDDDLERYLATAPFIRLTPQTLVDPKAIREALWRVRQEGYAIDNAEADEGLQCLAVPVRDEAGDVFAAISVARRQTGRWSSFIEALEPLREAAQALHQQIFPN